MTDHNKKKKVYKKAAHFSRRDFLKTSGVVVISVGLGSCAILNGGSASKGYLLVDTKKCQGCMTCMLACSLVHEGFESLSLARIQVVQNPFEGFPNDINIAQCRQCVDPACLAACQFNALHIDRRNGNIRTIDEEKCEGCKQCVEACPFEPGSSIWNFAEDHAQKCDLCANTIWQKPGGPGGKQACVTVCPMRAIQFTSVIPDQTDAGYDVNLRDESWESWGYTKE